MSLQAVGCKLLVSSDLESCIFSKSPSVVLSRSRSPTNSLLDGRENKQTNKTQVKSNCMKCNQETSKKKKNQAWPSLWEHAVLSSKFGIVSFKSYVLVVCHGLCTEQDTTGLFLHSHCSPEQAQISWAIKLNILSASIWIHNYNIFSLYCLPWMHFPSFRK